MSGPTRKLSAVQWSQLLQAARVAKETLLAVSAKSEYNISIAGGGSRLIGSSLSAVLHRDEVAVRPDRRQHAGRAGEPQRRQDRGRAEHFRQD